MGNNELPLVTVVIPIRNRIDFVYEALESLTSQSYGNIEIIISDNGSSADMAHQILLICKLDKRIRYRRNEFIVPMSIHFNQCLNYANGKYFIVLSDDDKISENYIEKFVCEFELDESLSLGLSSTKIIDENSEITDDINWVFQKNQKINGIDMLMDFILSKEGFKMPTFITIFCRRSDLININGYPDFEAGGYADTAIALMMMNSGNVICIEDAVFYYRVYLTSFGLSMSYEKLKNCGKQLVEYFKERKGGFANRIEVNLLLDKLSQMTYETFYYRIYNVYKLGLFNRYYAFFNHSPGFVDFFTIREPKFIHRFIRKIYVFIFDNSLKK
jgi:glycosyltransferase involved in cell wall biosynthesis